MTEDVYFPEFNGDTIDFLSALRTISRRRQEKQWTQYSEESEFIVKTYWHTYQIPKITIYSYLDECDGKIESLRRWLGIWKRYIESLNIIRDSLLLGLQGRIISATSLLRTAFEGIILGVFYQCLSQEDFRNRALIIKENSEFFALVEKGIHSIGDSERVSYELEFEVNKILLDTDDDVHIPGMKAMVKQIEQWEILEVDNPDLTLEYILHKKMYADLSLYSHSEYWASYSGRGGSPNWSLELGVEPTTVDEYKRYFFIVCLIVLKLFLGTTEEIQKTGTFADRIHEYIEDNQNISEIFKDVSEQIIDFTKEFRTNPES